MKISHTNLEGFIEEIADQIEDDYKPVVRWCVVSVPAEDRMSASDVYFVATFLIDGMVCELDVETGLEDRHVHPGRDKAMEFYAELKRWCDENHIPLKQGRFDNG